jgi:outer membrane protein TolC
MSTSIIKRISFMALLVLFGGKSKAQTALDSYIQEAFSNNDGIKQQRLQLDKSVDALREARSLFLPNVSLLAAYTKANGGRTIDLPIGDLLNPVYTTLNQLTATNSFPEIKNASILLNPDNYYDAKFRTSLPLINAEIYYNKQIKKVLITQQQAVINVYKRELVKSIKNAYYQYYQAGKAVDIYKNSLTLVNENIRINQSLLNNGVRNSTALTRSQTEKQKTDALITQAENNRRNAKAYFNFLLNKKLDSDIVMDTTVFAGTELAAARNTGSNEREELTQIRTGITAYGINTKLQRAYIVPKLNTFLDLGSQGFDWKYNNKTQYYIWGVNLQWDLFAAGKNHYHTLQAEKDVAYTELQLDNTEKALQLAQEQSENNYNTSVANYQSAKTQLVLAEKYYSDQVKIYKEGQLLYIELLDALNQLTNSQIQLAVTKANVLTSLAELERNQATYPIN